ncbi:endothelin-converting enzyme 1-like [Acropora palmata]|uniref:endothelin-converting enzyme 1-like n=1 Tax=Acropora palmata TaxID=6131 RepID=UPI003DA1193D
MVSTWSTDIRWTKLRQFEYGEPNNHVGELKKALQTASDESDDEWLAQLERDYATAKRKHRSYWTSLERTLTLALIIFIVITISLASVLIFKKYHVPMIFKSSRYGPDICETPGCVAAAFSILNHVDKKVDPCDDFYNYACGNWIKDNAIPPGHSKWTAFHQASDNNLMILRKILERSQLGINESAKVFTKAKNYFSACMNKTMIEDNGAQPLKKLIQYVGSWAVNDNATQVEAWSPESWNFELALSRIHKLKSMPLFYMFVSADDRNSSQNIIQVQQAGITLSNRDYYFRNETDKVVVAYKEFMVKIGTLLGGEMNSTEEQMREIFQFEKKLAEIYEPKERLRNMEKIYHKMTVADLQQLAPAISWLDYMNTMFSSPVTHEELVVVYTPEYLKNMSNLVIMTDRRILANYMVWHLIKPLVNELSKPFRDASLELMKAEKGVEGNAPQWKTCVVKTDAVMGFATGYLYIKERSGKISKKEAEDMIAEIKKAFIGNLPHVSWMDEETKTQALKKVSSTFDMIGYPTWVEDLDTLDKYYENLTIGPTNSFENYLEARRFFHNKAMNRRGKTINRKEWHMTPTQVNAYYNSPNNYIAFPSGILQRPFFDPDFPQSVNYGAVGVVMGHELTHGFDDRGRLFDEHGNLASWWNNQSVEAFQQHALCMVDQYGHFSVAGMKVNGKQTLSENIADNGGLKLAYSAYQGWIQMNGRELKLPGLDFTPEQLFFLGFAQVWCSASSDGHIQHALLTDAHSPERVRVLAAVSNSDEFAAAFQCPVNSTMNPVHKCQVW